MISSSFFNEKQGLLSLKQVSAPEWQTGPAGITFISMVPPCETVFAMTIHKSQGSEFDDVLIVLPEIFNPVLNKELLYTAVTRAKKTVKIATTQPIFELTIKQRVQRVSGLAQKLKLEANNALTT